MMMGGRRVRCFCRLPVGAATHRRPVGRWVAAGPPAAGGAGGLNTRTRYKLSANNYRINVRQHYFAEKVVSVWNNHSLSPSVVDFSSLSAFKRTIHNARLNLYTKY